MGIARMVGHITYLSAQSLGAKFGRQLQFADDIRYTLTEPEFQVENYLRYQAYSFVKRFDANTYLYTSRALTYFDLARQYGNGTLVDALRNVSARTLLIAFSSDWRKSPGGSEELAAALRTLGKDVELQVIKAPYGHDCFLLEEARQTPMREAVSSRQARRIGRASRRQETMERTPRTEQPRQFGSETRQVHAGQRPDPNTGARGGADLPDDQLRLRSPGVRSGVLQSSGVRQHLLANHEPDRGGVRGAHGEPRGWSAAPSRSPAESRRRRRQPSRRRSPAITWCRQRRSMAGR